MINFGGMNIYSTVVASFVLNGTVLLRSTYPGGCILADGDILMAGSDRRRH